MNRQDVLADRLEPWRRLARRVPGAMALGRWVHRRVDPELRAIDQLRRTAPATLLQPFPDSFEDRYAAVFAALVERLGGIERPRVLSFGCADGAELRSLRRSLPRAELVGIDLNPRALARARTLGDAAMRIRLAGDTRVEPPESFDAILAMAVLRHGELEAKRPAKLPYGPNNRRLDGVTSAEVLFRKPGQ